MIALFSIIAVFLLAGVTGLAFDNVQDEVYKRMLDDPLTYTGVETKAFDITSSKFIPIGVFSPVDEEHPAGRSLYRGACLAVEEMNNSGGYRTNHKNEPGSSKDSEKMGIPFHLVQRWQGDPWGAGSKEVIGMVYNDNVLAIIAYRDGAGHVAEQIALKAWVPVVLPLASDPSLTQARVPWVFRLPPDDAAQAEVLVKRILSPKSLPSNKTLSNKTPVSQSHRMGMISGTDHDSRIVSGAIYNELLRNQVPPVFRFQLKPGLSESRIDEVVNRIKQFSSDVPFDGMILCLGREEVLRLLPIFRNHRFSFPLWLPWIPGINLQKLRTVYDGDVFIVEPFDALRKKNSDGNDSTFVKNYHRKFGETPNPGAFYGYDAAKMVILAICKGGLTRSGVRRELQGLSGYRGISGVIEWDNGGGNPGKPVMKTK